jgi:hypothetical protein
MATGSPNSSGIRDNHARGSVAAFLRQQLKAGADLDLVTAFLSLFRELALGKAEPYAELCRPFDRQTEQGRSMGLYSDLLAASVEAVTAGFQRKLADGLQHGRHFVLPNLAEQVSPDSEFELVTWLVILEATQPP